MARMTAVSCGSYRPVKHTSRAVLSRKSQANQKLPTSVPARVQKGADGRPPTPPIHEPIPPGRQPAGHGGAAPDPQGWGTLYGRKAHRNHQFVLRPMTSTLSENDGGRQRDKSRGGGPGQRHPLCSHLAEQLCHPPHLPSRVTQCVRPSRTRRASRPPRRVGDEFTECCRQGRRVARRDQHATPGIDHLAAATDRCRHHRPAGVQRFHKCDPKWFRAGVRLA